MVNPAPQTMQVAIQDIDAKATRDAQGLLHRDRVATKRKINLSFSAFNLVRRLFSFTILSLSSAKLSCLVFLEFKFQVSTPRIIGVNTCARLIRS